MVIGAGTGIRMGTELKRASQCGMNRPGNGEREGPARAGRAAVIGGQKVYIGRGCAGVLGFYAGEEADIVLGF